FAVATNILKDQAFASCRRLRPFIQRALSRRKQGFESPRERQLSGIPNFIEERLVRRRPRGRLPGKPFRGLPSPNCPDPVRPTLEPSTGLSRQVVGEPFPRRLSRKVGWQKRASCTDTAE